MDFLWMSNWCIRSIREPFILIAMTFKYTDCIDPLLNIVCVMSIYRLKTDFFPFIHQMNIQKAVLMHFD